MLTKEEKVLLSLLLPNPRCLDNLTAWDWCGILMEVPPASVYCEWEKFDRLQLLWILRDAPTIMEYMPWWVLNESQWAFLLKEIPQCHKFMNKDDYPRLSKLYKRAVIKTMEHDDVKE